MLVGDWNEKSNYHLALNGATVNLKQLNKHVLQCTLPSFEHFDNLNYNLNTHIHFYENGRLYCEPMPFQIKYPSTRNINSNEILSCLPSSSEAAASQQSICYKYQLFLLERSFILLKYYNLNKFEYEYQLEDGGGDVKLSSDASAPTSFERRVCNLIYKLKTHLADESHRQQQHSNEIYGDMIRARDNAQKLLGTEHEGKSLLHLCSACGLNSLLISLLDLKKFIHTQQQQQQQSNSLKMQIIENELKLFKTDHYGNTPMVVISDSFKYFFLFPVFYFFLV